MIDTRLIEDCRTPPLVNQIIGVQALLTVVIPLALLLHSTSWALAALLGGLSCVLPTLCFARMLFRQHDVRTMAVAVIAGEIGKLALTVSFFIVIFVKYKDVNVLVLLLTYFMVHLSYWLVPIWADRT